MLSIRSLSVDASEVRRRHQYRGAGFGACQRLELASNVNDHVGALATCQSPSHQRASLLVSYKLNLKSKLNYAETRCWQAGCNDETA